MCLRLIGWCLTTNWEVQGVHFIVSLKKKQLYRIETLQPKGHLVTAAVPIHVLLLHMRKVFFFTISCHRNSMKFPLFIACVIFVCNLVTGGG